MSALLGTSTTVVELGDSLAGSYCGRLFVQLGATVVKVEPSGGSPLRQTAPFLTSPTQQLSATFTMLNAHKHSVNADLDSPDGRTVVTNLLREQADIVIMSGTAHEWAARDFPRALVRDIAPQAVVGHVTTFGDVGPYVDIVGGELQAQALGGLMYVIGEPSREPLRIGGFQAQYTTGLAMLTGFALGMFSRDQAGGGNSFSTSVIETVSQVEWKGAVSYQADGSIVTRGTDGAPAILKAKDGFFAFFYRAEDWPKVISILNDPRLDSSQFATQERRDLYRSDLLALLNDCTSKMSKRELYHKTQAGRMTTGYMATMGDLLESPQYLFRDFFEDIELGDLGIGRLPGPPWRVVSGTD